MRTHPPLSQLHPEVPAVALLTGLARVHQTVLLVDAEERIVWVSSALAEMCGADSMVGEPVRSLFAPTGEEQEVDARLQSQGCLVNEPVSLVLADGSVSPIDLSVVGVPGRRGEPTGTLLIVRRRGETRTSGSPPGSEYFQAVLDSSADAVITMDDHGFVTYVNPAFESLLDQPASRLIGAPVALAFSRRGSLQDLADALRPPRGDCGANLELTRKDGSDLALHVTSSPVVLPDGSVAGRVAFLRDVTEQRRSENELAHKNKELEHYVHTVSHDLRTPLVSLLGFSRLLAQDYGDVLTDTGRHFLERIEQASRNMEALINDLLELSRIGSSAGQHDLLDPLSIMKQLANELKPRLEAAGIALDLPSSPPLVKAERTQLYQVFSNLIGNAIDHMGDSDAAKIRVTIESGAGANVIGVHDNGTGIEPANHERVFEIFHTVHRPASGRRGTGIGLAIVKKIAEAHGGSVWLESVPGEGADFYVSLPGA